MNLLRKFLLPIVPIYYLVTWLRNKLYDWDIKKSVTYDFPVIAVGNLSVGGTGKSPMIEYLIRLLKKERNHIATLSRGYKRETQGFQVVEQDSRAKDVGDEPLQFKTKFPDIIVGVDGDRRNGISELRTLMSKPEVILLDDAYQHRKVQAGFYILLTAYYDLYCNDILLPTGNLREPRSGADRADIIIVTKCPENISKSDKDSITKKLNLGLNQLVLFSTIVYSDEIVNETGKRSVSFLKDINFTLVTGIANPKPLIEYYSSLGLRFNHINYPDHHNFSTKEIEELKKHEFIVTTEKDYMRLRPSFVDADLWYQSIAMQFVAGSDIFDKKIIEYIAR